MKTRRRMKAPIGLFMLLAMGFVLVVAGWPVSVEAQQSFAVVSAVTGRVEVLPQGQIAWQSVRLGMRIFEGADIRAIAGSNAELRLPDGSTVFVAENSRFVVTKLDFTPRNEMRAAFFHLAVGKLRGIVSRVAVALVVARQGDFAISTPTAVAAVRGTTIHGVFDPTTNQTAILVSDGVAIIRDIATRQLVTVTAPPGQPQAIIYTAGQLLPAPRPASAAEVAQFTAAAQPASIGAAAVLISATVDTVPANVVLVLIPPAAPVVAPLIILSPPIPPPLLREVSPSSP